MKRAIAIAVLVLAVAAFSLAAPAAASNKYFARFVVDYAENLFVGDACVGDFSYPANTPIFFVDGWAFAPWTELTAEEKAAAMGPNTDFAITLDGLAQHMPMVARYFPAIDLKVKFWDVEYDQGFPAGTEATFVGTWYVDGLLLGGVPGEKVLTQTCESTVTFG